MLQQDGVQRIVGAAPIVYGTYKREADESCGKRGSAGGLPIL
jgi:hypothetical protein